jgi:hypothetical protein
MSARLLLEIALRVFGIWFAFHSVNSLMSAASVYLNSQLAAQIPDLPYLVAALFATFIVQILLGCALICWAPNIAVRFYPPGSESEELRISVGPGDVYRTACFVLGAYLLVQAAESAGQFVIRGLQDGGTRDQLVRSALSAAVSFASGLLLVFGSRKIADLVSNLRYDPETIPDQKVSIAMLLVVLALVAVVLGVLRLIAGGN